jgi:hypothetical protein
VSVTTTQDIFASGVSLSAVGLYAWLSDFNDRTGRFARRPELLAAAPSHREVFRALSELEGRGFVVRSTMDGFAAFAVAGALQ